MTYDLEAQKLAIKAIGTVESNMAYTSVNYNDPITIGFMQWYGTRAAGLLGRIRTENAGSWVGIPASLTGDLDSHPATDSWWTNRYLTRAEGEPLRSVLNNNKPLQNEQAITDLTSYKNAAESAGMNPDTNTPGVLFFFVMYHQSPKRGLGVVRDLGPASDIDRLYSGALNEPVLGRYRTRYTTARDIIKSGDNTGIDVDPGTEPEPVGEGESGTGGSGGVAVTTPGVLSYVRLVGDALHIKFKDGHTLITVPNGSGMWLPTVDGSAGAVVPPAPPNPEPTTPPVTGAGGAARAALVEFMTSRINRYAYSQGASRLSPESNMYTDCSGLVYFAYQSVAGINIGTYTGSQYTQGTLVTQGSGTINESLLLPGDLVFIDWSGGRSTVDHVDMYIGDGNTCGHGGPDSGPDIDAMAPRIANAVKYIVRRYV